ncbi:hypothetical protein [Candidatus Nitronereus thalassa]|uniref:Uncharacterized protein n=1 Tax=Candidatus Nitronereus thalassa TaxID=3020898 RepID=A0ABU3K3N2_9BACT|nr:hypothetical protein [Candidatus Nitronereus thalassa]MDT7040986.1 hypothetical protein [Candidatus Nitronereus thalassa]
MVVPSFSCRNLLMSGKNVSRLGLYLVFCVLFIFSFDLAFGSEKRPAPKETLLGIKELFVLVNIGLSRSGPTQTKLQDLVEQKVSSLGLVVHSKDEYEEESLIPSLHINVAIIKGENNFHTFFVTIKLYQIVSLEQEGKVSNPSAVTWEVASMGVGGIESIQEKVEDLSEVFLMDYRAVN